MHTKFIRFLAVSALSFLSVLPSSAQNVNSDSWAATDALGRKVRSYDDAPAKRDGKFVAMFYWTWETADRCRFFLKGNKLVVRIPREALRVADGPVDLEFKWNDNMQEEGDIMDFYVNGDTAPGGRFNFVYKTE